MSERPSVVELLRPAGSANDLRGSYFSARFNGLRFANRLAARKARVTRWRTMHERSGTAPLSRLDYAFSRSALSPPEGVRPRPRARNRPVLGFPSACLPQPRRDPQKRLRAMPIPHDREERAGPPYRRQRGPWALKRGGGGTGKRRAGLGPARKPHARLRRFSLVRTVGEPRPRGRRKLRRWPPRWATISAARRGIAGQRQIARRRRASFVRANIVAKRKAVGVDYPVSAESTAETRVLQRAPSAKKPALPTGPRRHAK